MGVRVYPGDVRSPFRRPPVPAAFNYQDAGCGCGCGGSPVAFAYAANLVATMGANEFGAAVCEYPDGTLTHGTRSEGTPISVQISLDCPEGTRLAALWHTHPGGIPYPSQKDVSEARRVGVELIAITQPEQGITNIFSV